MMKKLFLWFVFLSLGLQAQNVAFADANFKKSLLSFFTPNQMFGNAVIKNLNGKIIKLDANNDGEIQISEAENVSEIYISVTSFHDITGIKSFINLKKLTLSDYLGNDTADFAIDVQGLSNLKELNLFAINNAVSPHLSINFQGTNLEILRCIQNRTIYLNLEDSPLLKILDISGNPGIDVDFSKVPKLKGLTCMNNEFTSIMLQDLNDLQTLNCSFNNISELDISKIKGLAVLDCSFNQLTSLDASKMTIGGDVAYGYLICSNNQLQDLNIKNLQTGMIRAENNSLTQVDFENVSTTLGFNFSSNLLTTIDLKKYRNNTDGLGNYLEQFDVSNNQLTSMFLKNGILEIPNDMSTNSEYFTFNGNPNLKFICSDDSEVATFQKFADAYGYQININSYCSFTPGGNYNTISGTVKFDSNINGCDASDNAFEFLKLKINDGANSGETFAQKDGKYAFYTHAGTFDLTALAENPSLFSVAPATFSTDFADNNNNIYNQDICVTANGSQNDAEVVIAPLTNARPGFDATYKLVWRNKGNTVLAGKVVLNYDANKMAFQNSSLPHSLLSNGSIEFDYTDLKPFANSSSEITFTVNTPTEPTNPVNSGDILAFNAQVTPSNTDIIPEDNNFAFDHTVVNSFDPNDIICLEGETVPVTSVGKYFHYVINFENTGTAEAENIVVKMNVDPTEFDINTLQLQNASANVQTNIVGDQVEFMFKKIKLATGGHGNVLLKMRSKSDLVEGDTVNNIADIYFDYNFPIVTNDYVTTINNTSNVLAAKFNYTASDFSTNNYPVEFDASLSTGSVSSYQWEFSGNPSISSSSAVKPTVTFNLPGNYTAKLTVSDAESHSSVKTVSFSIGGHTADLSTGKNTDNNFITIDSDEDDWKGYDINGTEMTPKVRHTFPGWSYADLGSGNNSQWISLNNYEGYFSYKSRAFTVPKNATDAKLNLRSLSFVRNWTNLVKVNPDGSEEEIEMTKTQWMNDGFKGWINSRSPKVDNYALSSGTYYIKVLVYSNNSTVRESLDVNAIVSCSAGLMNANKLVVSTPTLDSGTSTEKSIAIYPVPTRGEINISADENIRSIELYDSAGRILQKQVISLPSKNLKFDISGNLGIYYLKIKTDKKMVTQKIIKE